MESSGLEDGDLRVGTVAWESWLADMVWLRSVLLKIAVVVFSNSYKSNGILAQKGL